MIKIPSHKNLISQLLILVYLLIGSGMGNALFLCQDSEAFSHLEYTLVGKCQDDCVAENPFENSRSAFSARVSSTATDCLDTPVSLSHLSLRVENLLGDVVAADWSAISFDDVGNYPATELEILNLVAQPPPPQALAALRTVVLLN